MKKGDQIFNWFVIAAFVLVQSILIHSDSTTLIFLGNELLWNNKQTNSKKSFKCGEIKSEKYMFFN